MRDRVISEGMARPHLRPVSQMFRSEPCSLPLSARRRVSGHRRASCMPPDRESSGKPARSVTRTCPVPRLRHPLDPLGSYEIRLAVATVEKESTTPVRASGCYRPLQEPQGALLEPPERCRRREARVSAGQVTGTVLDALVNLTTRIAGARLRGTPPVGSSRRSARRFAIARRRPKLSPPACREALKKPRYRGHDLVSMVDGPGRRGTTATTRVIPGHAGSSDR